MQTKHYRRMLPRISFFIGLAIALIGLFSWSYPTAGAPPQYKAGATPQRGASSPPPQERTVKDAGAWKLVAAADGTVDEKGRAIKGAAVLYSTTEQSSIEAYTGAAQSLGVGAFTGHQTLPVLITFNRPVSFERFTSMMQDAKVEVKSYRIRTRNADGSRGTMGGSPERDGTIVSVQHVQDFLDRQQGKSGQVATIAGIIDAEIVVDLSGFARLNTQQEVYLVDAMRGVAIRELAQSGVVGTGLADIELRGPYAYLEDFGVFGR